MTGNVLPHSFLNFIFVNGEDYLKNDIDRRILLHELFHVRQKHLLDILLTGFLRVFFWFNPFLYFFKKAIQLNHEFLADQAVVEKFGEGHSYQTLLLRELSKQLSPALTSASNYFITKQQLIIITMPSSFVSTVCRKVAVVPVFIVAAFLFSTKTYAKQSGDNLGTSIVRMLHRNIVFPESLSTGDTGIALLHFSKSNDTLLIRMLYSSYKNYGAGVDRALSEIANKAGLNAKFTQDELIVPVFYQYFDGQNRQYETTLTSEAKKAITQLARNINVSAPVIMVGIPN